MPTSDAVEGAPGVPHGPPFDAAHEAVELRRHRRAVVRAVVLSIGVHLVPLLWWGFSGSHREQPPAVPHDAPPLVIELAPEVQSARSLPSDLRMAQDRRQVDRAVALPRPVPPKQPTLARTETPAEPVVALREKPEHPPELKPAQQPRDEQAASAAPQLLTPTPAQQTAAPTAGASTRASDARQTWEAQVIAALEKVKRYPPAARWAGQEDTVMVRFAISRTGAVSGVRILRSQRFAPLDNEARALPARAAPLPVPPASETEDPVVVTVPIDFYVQGS